MKKLAALLLTPVLCLGLAACAAGGADTPQEPGPALSGPVETVPVSQPLPVDLPDPEPVWTAAEGVTFSLLQDTYPVGTTKLTLVIENRTDMEVGWGTVEWYEKYVDGEWVKLDGMDDFVTIDVMILLDPQSVRTQDLTYLMYLPALDEGLYRVTGSPVFVGDGQEAQPWQVTFRVAADAQPEPDYGLYISSQPIPTVDGCLVTDRLPVYFINTTGEDGNVLEIPHLEVLDADGTWAEVPYLDRVGFCGTPSRLPVEGMAWSEELSFLWGSLEDGTYRLSYAVGPTFDTEETVSAEFTLYTPENNAGLPLAPQD